VRVEGGDGRIGVTEIDLELTEVLALLKKISGVRMAQGVHVRVFLTPLALRARRQPRCRVVRQRGRVAVGAPVRAPRPLAGNRRVACR
jgi:hypothetical protein